VHKDDCEVPVGGDGKDELDGGKGADVLDGGAGGDTLVVIDGDWDQTIRLDGIHNAKTVTQADFLLAL
jgi:Ca2+-binding RTX toxin-like protein